MFSIQFSSTNSDIDLLEDRYCGVIKINNFEELFYSSLSFWTKNQYQKSWVSAIKKILISGKNKSALITDIYNPQENPCIDWWLMYREGSYVYFQNQLITSETSGFSFSKFDPDNPYTQISPRITFTEDGDKISEWEIDIKSLEDFYNKILNSVL